jgi:hypothetical protein
MALVIIKEDGSGKVDANSYASAADGDAYHDGHLYATAWTAASAGNKEAALVMATRLIDSQIRFAGFKANDAQALQWPRRSCPDPDLDAVVATNLVPREIIDATCEMARELLILDRTAAPPGEGLKYQNVGSTQTGYSKTDVRPIISHVAQAMLAKFGAVVNGQSGSVPLLRT